MDPASLAIGLVPLVIKIVDMASTIRRRVSSYKSAPSDLISIANKTALIGEVCASLEVDLRSPNPRYGVKIMEQALKTCGVSIAKVHDELKKLPESGRKRSFQFLYNKADMEKSLSELDDSINMLNTCLNMSTCISISALASSDLKAPEFNSNESSITQVSKYEARSAPSPRRQNRATLAKSTTTSYDSGFFELSTSSKTTRDEHGIEVEHRYYLIGLPFIGAYLSLGMRYGSLRATELALDMPTYVYERLDKSLYDSITKLSPVQGSTMESVARWVEMFHLKPNTQAVDRNGHTVSVLGAALTLNRPEVFRYLFDRGGRELEDQKHIAGGLSETPNLCFSDRKVDLDPAFLYLEMRGPFLPRDEYYMLLDFDHHPKWFFAIMEACYDRFAEDKQDFLQLTMGAFSDILGFSKLLDWDEVELVVEGWARVVSKLFYWGFKVHEPLLSRSTMMVPGVNHTLLTYALESFISRELGLDHAELWLRILSQTSVEVSPYLRREFELLLAALKTPCTLLRSWDSLSIRHKLTDIYDLLCPPEVEFPNLEAPDDLRRVMPAFCRGTQWNLSLSHKSPSHLEWKRDRLNMDTEQSWPQVWNFYGDTVRNGWCDFSGLRNLSSWDLKMMTSYNTFLELMTSRFERRQERKWKKLKKKLNLLEESYKMPGSWELQWWEYQGAW